MDQQLLTAAPPPPEEMTLLIETEDGPHRVTLDFDFSSFGPSDVALAMGLGGGDHKALTVAFMFVKARQQVELELSAWAGFRDSLLPMFDGDGSMVVLEEE